MYCYFNFVNTEHKSFFKCIEKNKTFLNKEYLFIKPSLQNHFYNKVIHRCFQIHDSNEYLGGCRIFYSNIQILNILILVLDPNVENILKRKDAYLLIFLRQCFEIVEFCLHSIFSHNPIAVNRSPYWFQQTFVHKEFVKI